MKGKHLIRPIGSCLKGQLIGGVMVFRLVFNPPSENVHNPMAEWHHSFNGACLGTCVLSPHHLEFRFLFLGPKRTIPILMMH